MCEVRESVIELRLIIEIVSDQIRRDQISFLSDFHSGLFLKAQSRVFQLACKRGVSIALSY